MTFSPESTSQSSSRSEKLEAQCAMVSSFKRSFNGIIFRGTTTMQDYKDCKGSMQARRSQTDVSQLTYCRGQNRVSVETEFIFVSTMDCEGMSLAVQHVALSLTQ